MESTGAEPRICMRLVRARLSVRPEFGALDFDAFFSPQTINYSYYLPL